MELQAGQVVFSKAGRDKTKAFVILSVEGEYAYIINGHSRTLDKPKKKKRKHLQPVNHVIDDLREKFINKFYVLDADIRKALIPFEKQ